MIRNFSSLLRSGLIALGVAAGISAPAFAVPIAAGFSPAAQPAAQERGAGVILVQREFSGDGRFSRRDRNWRYPRRHWDDGYRWRDRRHYRRHWRRHHRYDNWYGGSGIYFGLGVPAYRYHEPRYYAPRRVYRSGRLSGAHVQWCYNRYRSYRDYDNTFQPYHGPRQQCWSPYS